MLMLCLNLLRPSMKYLGNMYKTQIIHNYIYELNKFVYFKQCK